MPIHTDLKIFEKYATKYEQEKMPMGAIYTINQEYGEALACREAYNEMVRKLAECTPSCTFIDTYACKESL